MTTQAKAIAVGDAIMLIGTPVTLEAAQSLVGRQFEFSTKNANETALFTVESVSKNLETGDVAAWMVRPGKIGGRHTRIVSKV